MPHSVLIVDDDVDFNSLLTDIFEQADYIVTSMTDPREAQTAFQETDFDIVVTDQRMPEISGEELMKFVKGLKPEVPVIMVSGYLENDTIRDLIREGVGGVFLKPLNIFSLLERTSELIEEAKRLESAPQDEEEDLLDVADTGLGFAFRSYPCKTSESASFAEKLHSLRNFKSTLSLIGEPGMNYRGICEDIREFYEEEGESFVFLSPSSFDSAQMISLVQDAKAKGATRVTCVLLDLVDMNAEQKALAIAIPKSAAPFVGLDVPLRAVYCVGGDIDQLLDEEVIDENLYIMIGTTEVVVPPLRDCKVDVAIMAQQLVSEIARRKNLPSAPRFEKSAKDLLASHPWERNYDELRETIVRLMDSNSGDLLTCADVKDALGGGSSVSPKEEFNQFLANQRDDILNAASILLGGNRSKVASFFALENLGEASGAM